MFVMNAHFDEPEQGDNNGWEPPYEVNTTEIIDELCKGIVRIVYVDEHSVEHENNFTLCRNHLPKSATITGWFRLFAIL